MLAVTLFASILGLTSAAGAGGGWSYDDAHTGPKDWGTVEPNCKKTRQSPINLVNPTCVTNLTSITLTGYSSNNGQVILQNSGGTAKATPNSGMTASLPTVTGTWKALQFHFHWGTDVSKGSEHAIEGTYYPLEMHIVHMNSKYPDINAALAQADGLAVLGFMFKAGSANNSKWESFLNSLQHIKYEGNSTTLDNFTMSALMPSDDAMKSYYRYQGSLTTPPCSEAVTWTVFSQPIELSEAQLAKFSTIDLASHMENNFRPVLPLGSRTLYASDEKLCGANGGNHVTTATVLLVLSSIAAMVF